MNHLLDSEIGMSLRFFGKMTASISHEIKNVMAIINESAGLLEDYCFMSEKGVPIDPEKLKVVAQRVSKQIQRADGIAVNMNSLAHSVDDFQKSVGLIEILELSVGLALRLADMRSVKLDLQLPQDPLTIITSPFHLLSLLWQVLDFAMGATGDEKTVGITFEKDSHMVKIRFSGLESLKDLPSEIFPTEKEETVLRILNAKISKDANASVVFIELPKDIRPLDEFSDKQ
jgi:signal transduction histidine kinase